MRGKKVYNTRSAAKFLGVSRSRVQQFAAEGRIGWKEGSGWLFGFRELKAFERLPRLTGVAINLRKSGKTRRNGLA